MKEKKEKLAELSNILQSFDLHNEESQHNRKLIKWI